MLMLMLMLVLKLTLTLTLSPSSPLTPSRYLLLLAKHVQDRRVLRRAVTRLGDRNRRKVGLAKGLKTLRQRAHYARYRRHAVAVRRGGRMHAVYSVFSALRRWYARSEGVLKPVHAKLRLAMRLRSTRLQAVGLLAFQYQGRVRRTMSLRAESARRHVRRRQMATVLLTLRTHARKHWRVARRYKAAQVIYHRHLARMPLRRWSALMVGARAHKLLCRRADRVRQKVAIAMFHVFMQRRLGYVKGMKEQTSNKRMGYRFWRSIRMLRGWRDFSHYVQIMRAQREAVEVVVHDWNILVKRRVFGSVKNQFHKPAHVEEQCAASAAYHVRGQLRRWQSRTAVLATQAREAKAGAALGTSHMDQHRTRRAFMRLVACKNTHHMCARQSAHLRERVLLGVTGSASWFR